MLLNMLDTMVKKTDAILTSRFYFNEGKQVNCYIKYCQVMG